MNVLLLILRPTGIVCTTITIVLLLVARLVVVYYDMHITVMTILLWYEI